MSDRSNSSHNFAVALAGILPPAVPVALLDFPWHDNPGDAAIWKGENLALANLGHRVVYTATTGTFDQKRLDRLLPSDGVVLLHGGGNFGDLWPDIHFHRLSIVERLRNRRIVQLPQTVHFDDEKASTDSLSRLADHRDLTVMARDQSSLDFLKLSGITAHLSEDPTSALWPEPSAKHVSKGPQRVLFLLRSDRERQQPIPAELVSKAQDWTDLGVTAEPTDLSSWATDHCLSSIDRAQRLCGRALPSSCRARRKLQRLRTNRLFDTATEVILAHDVIVTDRLHAMLFGLAYGRQVVVIESGYGKLNSYIDTFLSEEPHLHRLNSSDHISEVLGSIGISQ